LLRAKNCPSLARIAALLAIALVGVHFAAALTIDLGSYATTRPQITVTYSQPVRVDEASLIFLGEPQTRTSLCSMASGYNRTFQLRPGNGCTGAQEPLAAGKYLLEIAASDTQGHMTQPDPVDQRTFTLTGLEIVLIEPPTGVGSTNPVPITLITRDPGSKAPQDATCVYTTLADPLDPANFESTFDTLTSVTTTGGSTHSFSYPGRGRLQLLCRASGEISWAGFDIGFDATPPIITAITVSPEQVTDPGRPLVAVSMTTNEETVCTSQIIGRNGASVEGSVVPFTRTGTIGPGEPVIENRSVSATFSTDHETAISVLNESGALVYRFTCENRAGLIAYAQRNITVNMTSDLVVLSPGSTSATRQVTAAVRTTFDPDACTVNGNAMTRDVENRKVHRLQISLAEGTNGLSFTCHHGSEATTVTHWVRVDSMVPIVSNLSANATICGGTLRASFAGTDGPNGTGIARYTYTLTDGNLTIENATTSSTLTIRVPTSFGQSATLTIVATDGAGNNGTPATVSLPNVRLGTDDECTGTSFITLVQPPPIGFSTSQSSYPFQVRTLRTASCRYSPAIDSDTWSVPIVFDQSSGTLHSKTLQFDERRILVNCTEPDGARHAKIFTVGRDASPPKISIEVIPSATIVDRTLSTPTLRILTDDRAVCVLDGEPLDGPDNEQQSYVLERTTILDYSDAADGTRTLKVLCTNRAQLKGEATQNIVLAFSQTMRIDVLSPARYTADNPVVLRVRPSKQSQCTYTDAEAAPQPLVASGATLSATLSGLEDGSHSYIVECVAIADGERARAVVDFTVERETPIIERVEGQQILCPATTGTYTVTVKSLDPDPLISYDVQGTGIGANSLRSVFTIPASSLEPGAYEVEIVAQTRSGVNSAPYTYPFEVHAGDSLACSASGSCENRVKDAGEDGIDCGGACTVACLACIDATDCDADETCMNGVCVGPPTGCSFDDDCPVGLVCQNDVCVQGTGCTSDSECGNSQVCDAGTCREPPAQGCTSADECLPGQMCTVGVCINPAGGCFDNDDCEYGHVCFAGACVFDPPPVDLCTNGVKDGDEDGLDCGGSCPACVQCVSDQACLTGEVCIANVCVPVTTHNQCSTDDECPGQRCIAGICVGIVEACTSHNDCRDGFACVLGQCVQPSDGCNTNDDCSSAEVCFGKACVPAPPPADLCTNGVWDGDEDGLDCGGSCPACIACYDDAVCQGDACIEEVCVDPFPRDTCTDNVDCVGQYCVEGLCTGSTYDRCTDGVRNGDEEAVDCGGSCAACVACFSLEDCAAGTVCGDEQVCVPAPRGNCFDGVQNGAEQGVDCGGQCGACEPNWGDDQNGPGPGTETGSENQVPGLIEEKSYLLSIVLIALGVALMGGAGYFLYDQHEKKGTTKPYMPATVTGAPVGPASAQMSPELEARYRALEAERRAKLQDAYRKSEEAKRAKRKAVFGAFDGAGSDAASGTATDEQRSKAGSPEVAADRSRANSASEGAEPATGKAVTGKAAAADSRETAKAPAAGTAMAERSSGPSTKEVPSSDAFVELDKLVKTKPKPLDNKLVASLPAKPPEASSPVQKQPEGQKIAKGSEEPQGQKGPDVKTEREEKRPVRRTSKDAPEKTTRKGDV
jgi:hypothetical protein